jgi:hypothetical protein
MLQDAFLKSSADVTVTFIEEKDTTLLIYGDLVNRPFAYNVMRRRSMVNTLKRLDSRK